MARVPLPLRVLLMVVSLLTLMVAGSASSLAATGPAPAAGVPSGGPTISLGTPTFFTPGTIMIRGTGFTPGGKVDVALLDPWGKQLHATRWVRATAATAGTAQHAGTPGGTFATSFGNLCGTDVLVRAYDAYQLVWSNWLALTPTCSPESGVPISTTP